MLFNKLNILKYFFYIFPIMMLTSSGYITAYVSVFTIFSLYYFYYYKIKINVILSDYLIIIFFLISLTSTFFNIQEIGNLIFFKSILDLRFAILFLIVRNILDYKIINLKKFFILSLISIVFLAINIFLQHIIGFDIFGHPPFDKRYNGLFGSEAIAGSYMQKFSLISILSILLLKFNKKKELFLTMIVINFIGLGILMSLDRMPLIIYVFSITMLTIFIKKFRLKFLTSLIIFFIIFQFLFHNYTIINNRYLSLFNEINFTKIQKSFFYLNQKINKIASPNNLIDGGTVGLPDEYQYFQIYNSAYKLFLKKPLIGSGVKSFFPECYKLLKSGENLSCSTHPHNIYLEILVNQGIAGFFIFIVFFITLLIKNFNFLLKKNTTEIKLLTIFFITILITELWPFRSYGSIFQTVNGSIFWFFLALVSSKPYIKKN